MGSTPSKGSGKVQTGPKLLNLSVQTPPLTSLEHLAEDYAHYLTPSLTTLNVSHNSLSSLPPSLFGHVTSLESLNLSGNMLETLPVTLPQLKHLRELYLGMNRFSVVPEPVFYLSTSLTALELPSNELTVISEKIGQLVNLTRLDLSSNLITALPDEIGSLTNLVYLRARANKIDSVTLLLGRLTRLATLDLRQNEIEVLEASCLPDSDNLERLLLTDNYLRSLPDSLANCTGITELDAAGNKLTSIPCLNTLTALKRLMLHDNRLSDTPLIDELNMLREVDLRSNQLTSLENLRNCPSLQLLSVRDNNLMVLPKNVAMWKNLEEFDASVNLIEEIPEELANITPLTRLYLSDNHISDVPTVLTKLTNLKLLGLAYNDLDDESFPPEIWAGFVGLVELRLLGNKLTALPKGFSALPKLDRLFVGYNEFVPHGEEPEPPSFSRLELTQLGISGNCNLTRIPDSLLGTTALRKLWMGDCGIKKIPGAISNLQQLEVLDFSHNKLTKLTKKVCTLSNLIELLVPHNDLTKLPSEMDRLTSLQLLDVSWNPKLNKFPAGVARINGLLQVKALYCSIDELPEPWMSFSGYPPPPPPLAGLMLASEKPPAPSGLQLKWLALEGNPIDGYTLPNFVKFRVDQELRAVEPKSRPRLSDLRGPHGNSSGSGQNSPGSQRSKSFDEPSNPASIPVDKRSQRLPPVPIDSKCFYDLNLSEMQGVRPTMEDAFLVQDHHGIVVGPYTFELLAIFDGHADAACAEFCATHMHDILQQELSYALQPKDTSTSKVALLYKADSAAQPAKEANKKSKRSGGGASDAKSAGENVEYEYFKNCVKHGLRNTFKRMNDCIDEYEIQSGCTVALALFCGNDAWFVSCGDARITLAVGNRAIRATVDHKASDREERHRIQALGGYITDGGRIMGMIAVARSLGDRAFRPYVAYTPAVKWMCITEEARFAIIACDGLWDVVSDEFAVKIVSDFYRKHGTYNGAALMLRDSAYVLGSGDNISTMVVGLRLASDAGNPHHHHHPQQVQSSSQQQTFSATSSHDQSTSHQHHHHHHAENGVSESSSMGGRNLPIPANASGHPTAGSPPSSANSNLKSPSKDTSKDKHAAAPIHAASAPVGGSSSTGASPVDSSPLNNASLSKSGNKEGSKDKGETKEKDSSKETKEKDASSKEKKTQESALAASTDNPSSSGARRPSLDDTKENSGSSKSKTAPIPISEGSKSSDKKSNKKKKSNPPSPRDA